jgi:hypothetical protein
MYTKYCLETVDFRRFQNIGTLPKRRFLDVSLLTTFYPYVNVWVNRKLTFYYSLKIINRKEE